MLTALLVAAAAAAPSPEVQAALEALREERREASLDATAYPPSPYQSPAELPGVISVETSYQAFNDYYYFALVDGRLWYKPRLKRPLGEAEWETGLSWRPFGVSGGLPYRLDARKPEDLDTTYADGDRGGFVEDRLFETAAQERWPEWVDAEGWAGAGEWGGEAPPRYDADFPTPERLLAITADDDEVAVLGSDRQMYYRRKYANLFVNTEWYVGWGQGKKLNVFFPDTITAHRGWSLGRITAFGAGYKEGPDGRIFEWGPAAVSMETMVWLSPDGRRVIYLDSGTPPELVHFIEMPLRGRLRAEGIDSSASTIMLIDRHGAVLTKIADFDLLGSTPTHPYCYFEACDDEPYYPPGDIRSGMSEIRLPPEGWRVHSPVLPPYRWSDETWISSRITIVQTGKGNAARELRVVGALDGTPGYFFKPLLEETWAFRAAPEGDQSFREAEALRLSQADLSAWSEAVSLGSLHDGEPVVDRELVGRVELDGELTLELWVADFNLESTVWHAVLSWREVSLPIELHLVQAWNPYMPPRPADPGDAVVTFELTLGFDRQDLERRMGGGEASSPEGLAVRRLLDDAYLDKFALVVNATSEGFEVRPKRLRRVGRGFAVALSPALAPESGGVEDWLAAFWAQLEGHMGWAQEVAALEQAPGGDAAYAARVLELSERMRDDTRALKKGSRKARRFSRFTFGLSGFFYASQLKTIDAALDNRRQWRDADVRPNELRFNVITGVTSRIPYLSGNQARVQKRRWRAARDEAEALEARMQALEASAQ